MGYTTKYFGIIQFDRTITVALSRELKALCETYLEDCKYLGSRSDLSEVVVPDYWCQWIPTEGRAGLTWNGNDKFYEAEEWIHWLAQHFFPRNLLNGTIYAVGEEPGDVHTLNVVDSVVTRHEGLFDLDNHLELFATLVAAQAEAEYGDFSWVYEHLRAQECEIEGLVFELHGAKRDDPYARFEEAISADLVLLASTGKTRLEKELALGDACLDHEPFSRVKDAWDEHCAADTAYYIVNYRLYAELTVFGGLLPDELQSEWQEHKERTHLAIHGLWDEHDKARHTGRGSGRDAFALYWSERERHEAGMDWMTPIQDLRPRLGGSESSLEVGIRELIEAVARGLKSEGSGVSGFANRLGHIGDVLTLTGQEIHRRLKEASGMSETATTTDAGHQDGGK